MKDLIVWITIWYFVWGTFNIKLRWSLEQFKSKKYVGRGLFFLFAFLIIYFLYNRFLITYSAQLLISVIIANMIGVYLGFKNSFFKKFTKDRYFLLFQTFNILFQQSMVIASIYLIKNIFGDNYTHFHYGLWFFLVHLPVLFLPCARLRILYLIYSLFGGVIFSYTIANYQYGLIINFLFHYCVYIWTIYYIKDEEKI